jgi:hypothetical protein
LAVDDRHGLAWRVRQADEADTLWVEADRVGQLLAGFETFRCTAQGFPATAEDQFLEGVVGAGVIIPRIQMNAPPRPPRFFPGFDLAAEDPRQLLGVELVQRVLRVKDDGQAVDGDDLLGGRAFQVAERRSSSSLSLIGREAARSALAVFSALKPVLEPWAATSNRPGALAQFHRRFVVRWPCRGFAVHLEQPCSRNRPSTSAGPSAAPMVLEP